MTEKEPGKMRRTGEGLVDELQASLEGFLQGPIAIEHIVGALGARSFGLGILIFALPMIIPMPPGIPMTAGFIISIFAIQLLMGRQHLWLPHWLNEKTIQRDALVKAYALTDRYLGWMFKLARPRFPQLTGAIPRRISGIIFIILAVLMILPIPFIGNILPAFACTVLALGLTDRDGIIYIIGIIISGLAIFGTVLMGLGALDVLKALL